MFVRCYDRFRFPLAMTMAVCLLVLITACKPETPVTVERVPKDRSGIQWMRDLGPRAEPGFSDTGSTIASAPVAAQTPTRMVVAIFQRPEAAWFFKITGSPSEVTETESQWRPFFDSVGFKSAGNDSRDSEQPVWDLPDRWSDGGTAQMVFAILKMPDTDTEIRISRLGGQQDLLSNVNRWRGQLSLTPTNAESLDQQLPEVKGENATYRLFDQQGQSSGQSMGGPFSGGSLAPTEGQRGQMVKPSRSTASQDGDSQTTGGSASPEIRQNDLSINPKFTLDPPPGYQAGKTSAMVVTRFVKESVEGKVQISVVPLTATNQWNDNVNFWRQSVGMTPADDGEIESLTQPVSISGIDGKMIKLLSQPSSDSPSLIGVMIKHDDAAWFFKMMGDRKMVAEDQSVFDAFLKSFKFTQ